MHIYLKGKNGHIDSIKLNRVNNHKALHHLDKLLSNTQRSHCKTLHKIQIDNSLLNSEDFSALKNIFSHCPNLFAVELHSNHINECFAKELFEGLSLIHLKTLSFTDNWIGEKISRSFFDFIRVQEELTYLDFSLNWLRDEGVKSLLGSINTNIEQLNLSCNDFQSEGMMAVSRFAIPCPHLCKLDLSYNHLEPKYAPHIAKIINENDSIYSINLSSNQLNDGGALIIAEALSHNKNSFRLNLSDNQLTNKGAKYLIESSIKEGAMREFDLRHNSILKDDLFAIVDKLNKKNPHISLIA